MNSITMNFSGAAEMDAAYAQLKKLYPKNRMAKTDIDIEELEDEWLLALAMDREERDAGVWVTFEEHLARHGMTQEELDSMEDVELE
jgi:hypothetical protein